MITLIFFTDRSSAIHNLVNTLGSGLLNQIYTSNPAYDIWVWEDANPTIAAAILGGGKGHVRPPGLLGVVQVHIGA